MAKWLIMAEGCRWIAADAGANHKTAYSMHAHWFKPSTKIAVMETATGATKIFQKQLDAAGNLIDAQEVKP